jgi:PAS domain S-box-containing protein
MDTGHRYTLWNKAMERISGYKKEEMLGKNAFDVFPFLRDVGMDKLYQAAFDGKVSRCPLSPYEVAETGAKGFFEQTNVPIYNEQGTVVGLLAVVRDVTEAKGEIEALEDKIRKLEERLRAYE